MKISHPFRLAFVFICCALPAGHAAELVHLDASGVVRWNADNREVALFGANYCLPSASDYRAAGYVGADRKKLVEKDMLHFARMGWDGMRLCLWGDWENSDREGNLIVNDHLDVMDYAIAEAKKRGIYILFTPITTYSAWWPDAKQDDPYPGFSKQYQRSELGTNPAAIAAQRNYIRQIMEHVNPYTGVALKDEPQIIFVEMINEPHHHPENFGAAVAYIETLAAAVRDTGCRKILFHNLTQDMSMVPVLKASSVPGLTLGWYPTGLIAGRLLHENYLRTVDEYGPMQRADLNRFPKLVYEFDSADMNSGYMYPAMVRAFRGVGVQFSAMFAYDMLDTAPYNLGWQTHFLNLVYSPRKAMSSVIAAEAMKVIPRYSHYGDYPDNRRFGPIRVSYEEDSSELVTDEIFLYANDTKTAPPAPAKLRRVAGCGSSPLVEYEGNGTYFLDQIAPGVWRLEVYPDAVLVQDPFAQKVNYQTVSARIVWKDWPMTVRLPDLGGGFSVAPLDKGNTRQIQGATNGKFAVGPGVYLLSKEKTVDRSKFPTRIGYVGLAEFACPPAPVLPAQIVAALPVTYPASQSLTIAVDIVAERFPEAVTLQVRPLGQNQENFRPVSMARDRGYRYSATVVPPTSAGFEYYVSAQSASGSVRHPAGEGAFLVARATTPADPLPLFSATNDIAALVYTRIGDTVRRGLSRSMPATATDPAALRLTYPLTIDRTLDDYTASLAVKTRIVERRAHLAKVPVLRFKARGAGEGRSVHLSLVEADGTAWSKRLTLTSEWSEQTVPLDQLTIAQGVKLPLGYPERWNYWTPPAKGRGAAGDRVNPAAIEHVQISFRRDAPPPRNASADDSWADIASIALTWETAKE
jgi:hypothetical protein